MYFFKPLLLAVFLGVLGDLHWAESLEEAKSLAAEEKKLILLVFSGSDWCRNCILLDQEVFEDPEFQKMATSHLVLLKADFPRRRKNQLPQKQQQITEGLARRFNPEGSFPKVVLMNSQEQVMLESGYRHSNKREFLEKLKARIL